MLAAATALSAVVPTPAASASAADGRIEIGPRVATLTTAAARVEVQRRPFRLRVAPRHGSRALATAPGDRRLGGTRYAPFAYTVGAEPALAYPVLSDRAGPPAGAAPKRYAARAVRSLTREGSRLRIVLATDDPSGRVIVARIGANRAGTVSLDVRISSPVGVSAVAAAFASGRDEAFHGFGGRRESTDLRGRTFQNWVLDYRYPDASTGYYAPQASFISSRGYGLLLDGERIARWRLASDTPGAWQVMSAGAALRLVVAPGGVARAMGALSEITGRHRVAPAWSLGPTLSRTFGILRDGRGVYRAKVAADVARLERERWPVSAYAFEGWAGMPRAEVNSLIGRLRARGIRSLLYLRSFVADDTAGTEPAGSYDAAVSRGYVATTSTGAPYLIPSPFPGAKAAVIDFTDPAARAWWSGRVEDLLDTGAEGFMNDFGEQVLPGMRFHDGSTGATMHNRHPVLQAQVTRAAVDRWERRHPGRAVFFFQRAGFSGRPGSASYETAQFPGDETVDWQPGTGLPSVVPDMLNRAVGGAPGFTMDIGGYAQFTRSSPILPPTGSELFVRWSQAAALTPFFRVHNSGLDGVRMPWDYDAATRAAWLTAARLHRRAEPLVRRLWREFSRTGVPMTRPLWLADPAGARGARGDDEWLLGPDLLVAPVLAEGRRSRAVRLPAGCWRRHGTGPRLPGARTVIVAAPLADLPWFARCGTRPI